MWKYKGNELSSAKNCSGDVWEHKIPTTATKTGLLLRFYSQVLFPKVTSERSS